MFRSNSAPRVRIRFRPSDVKGRCRGGAELQIGAVNDRREEKTAVEREGRIGKKEERMEMPEKEGQVERQ